MKTLLPWPLALAVTLGLVACRERAREVHANPSAAPVPWAPSFSSTAPPLQPSKAPTFPVKWVEDLNLSSLSEVDARLAAEDALGFGELARGAERVLPKTCLESLTALRVSPAPNASSGSGSTSTSRPSTT